MKKIFSEDNIILNQSFKDKYEAITYAGEILVKNGYTTPEYIESMLEREKVASVYIGNHVAIPHGVSGSEKNILKSGISFVQVPDGVPFDNGEIAYLIIGIAGKGDEHMGYLEQIAFVCSEEENIIKLKNSVNKEEILKIFEEVSI